LITPESAFAALAWIISSLTFSWYISNFGNYNATYGSLGAAIGMMTWMWISMIVILVGAQLNAEIEQQTAGPTSRSQNSAKGGPKARATGSRKIRA
jgi:membrane protein